jgi:hypothetical protein
MQILVSRAGLVLNPGQVADLVLAWRQIAGLIAGMPHARPLADDMALRFRLPPPAPPPDVRQAKPAATRRAKAEPKRAAKPTRAVKPKAAAKRASPRRGMAKR